MRCWTLATSLFAHPFLASCIMISISGHTFSCYNVRMDTYSQGSHATAYSLPGCRPPRGSNAKLRGNTHLCRREVEGTFVQHCSCPIGSELSAWSMASAWSKENLAGEWAATCFDFDPDDDWRQHPERRCNPTSGLAVSPQSH